MTDLAVKLVITTEAAQAIAGLRTVGEEAAAIGDASSGITSVAAAESVLAEQAEGAAAAASNVEVELAGVRDAVPEVARAAAAEASLAREADGAAREIQQVRSAAAGTGAELGGAFDEGADDARRLALATAALRREIASIQGEIGRPVVAAPGLGSQLGSIRNQIIGVYAAAQGLSAGVGLVNLADDYGALGARIRIAGEEGPALVRAQREIFQIAQETRGPLEALSGLFTRLNPPLRELGQSQAQVLAVTSLVSKSLAITGASGAEAAGALNQFAQAMGAGTFRGDEFNSVAEQAPGLMKALADGLGVGRGELRKFAEDGKLTADFVSRALLSQSDAIDEQFGKLPVSAASAAQQIRNAFQKALGEANQSTGVTAGISSALQSLARNMSTVLGSAAAVGVAGLTQLALAGGRAVVAAQAAAAAEQLAAARLVQRATAAVATANAQNLKAAADLRSAQAAGAAAVANGQLGIAEARATATALELTAAQNALAAATTRAAGAAALGSRILGALGGPVGIAITALTALAGWWFTVGKNSEDAGDKQESALERATRKAAELNAATSGKRFLSKEDNEDLAALAGELGTVARRIQILQDLSKKTSDPLGVQQINDGLVQARAQYKQLNDDIRTITSSATTTADLQKEFAGFVSKPDKKKAEAAAPAAEIIDTRGQLLKEKATARVATNVSKAEGDQERAALEARLQLREITYQQYYARLAQLAEGQLGAEKNALNVELQALDQAIQAQQANPGKTPAARAQGEARINQLQAERIELLGRIKVLEIETGTAAATALGKMQQASFQDDSAPLVAVIERLQAHWQQLSAEVTTGARSQASARQAMTADLEASLPPADALITKLREVAGTLGPDAVAKVEEYGKSLQGLRQATQGPLEQLRIEWTNSTDAIEKATADWTRRSADLITEFLTKGKADFKGFANAIIAELLRIQVQKVLANVLGSGQGGGGGGGLGGVLTAFAGLFSTSPSSSGSGGGFFTASSAANGAGGYNFAEGGLFRGAGTSTSDSNQIWVSDKEYIVNARAVEKAGVPFLDRINRGELPRMRGYATGGSTAIDARRSSIFNAGDSSERGGTSITVNAPVNATNASSPAEVARIVEAGRLQTISQISELISRRIISVA